MVYLNLFEAIPGIRAEQTSDIIQMQGVFTAEVTRTKSICSGGLHTAHNRPREYTCKFADALTRPAPRDSALELSA